MRQSPRATTESRHAHAARLPALRAARHARRAQGRYRTLDIRACRHCGYRISVPWWGHGLTVLPMMLVLLLGMVTQDGGWLLIGIAIAFVAYFMLRLYAVPIVSREADGQRRV